MARIAVRVSGCTAGDGCRAGWMLVRIECVLVRNPYPEIRAYGVYGQTVIWYPGRKSSCYGDLRWRCGVADLTGGQEVAGSNPVVPTSQTRGPS